MAGIESLSWRGLDQNLGLSRWPTLQCTDLCLLYKYFNVYLNRLETMQWFDQTLDWLAQEDYQARLVVPDSQPVSRVNAMSMGSLWMFFFRSKSFVDNCIRCGDKESHKITDNSIGCDSYKYQNGRWKPRNWTEISPTRSSVYLQPG